MASSMKLSQRAQRIEPFYVMEMGKTAAQYAQQFTHTDRPMIALNIGEPDFTAPPLVQAAAQQAIQDGQTQYTHALGLQALRERISHWYAQRWGLAIDPSRIVVTAGASAALHLACMALVDEGDDILLPDPSYPCNRQFVQAAGGRALCHVGCDRGHSCAGRAQGPGQDRDRYRCDLVPQAV
jgi:aspartate/methionine/tyrosine aminotransferase